MKRYTVELDRAAQKQLRAIKDRRLRDALERDIHALADDQRPLGCLKLVGHKDHWRIRVGNPPRK
jgi:mRNA interferase RelE/StbE